MKGFADRFKVALTGRKADKSDREELRLLPRPLYRHELSDEPGPVPTGSMEECLALSRG